MKNIKAGLILSDCHIGRKKKTQQIGTIKELEENYNKEVAVECIIFSLNCVCRRTCTV